MTEKEDPYHLSGKPLPTTRIAPTNYTETARIGDLATDVPQHQKPDSAEGPSRYCAGFDCPEESG